MHLRMRTGYRCSSGFRDHAAGAIPHIMTQQEQGDFCYDFAREDDGAIAFRCSDDAREWPWLTLHPADNIAVQATNYYALTGVSRFSERMDGSKWTALTKFSWRSHETGEGALHPARGRASHDDDGIGYACAFVDINGARVYDVSGAGVVFANRDFEAWRAKAKAKIMALPAPDNFAFAEAATVGVKTQGEVFVAPLTEDNTGVYADALLTAQSAFRPVHPFHGGSGDHVNSSHLCDVVQQTAHLIRGSGFTRSGSAVFSRYVELGRPFRVGLAASAENNRRLSFSVEQAGAKCADIELVYDD